MHLCSLSFKPLIYLPWSEPYMLLQLFDFSSSSEESSSSHLRMSQKSFLLEIWGYLRHAMSFTLACIGSIVLQSMMDLTEVYFQMEFSDCWRPYSSNFLVIVSSLHSQGDKNILRNLRTASDYLIIWDTSKRVTKVRLYLQSYPGRVYVLFPEWLI